MSSAMFDALGNKGQSLLQLFSFFLLSLVWTHWLLQPTSIMARVMTKQKATRATHNTPTMILAIQRTRAASKSQRSSIAFKSFLVCAMIWSGVVKLSCKPSSTWSYQRTLASFLCTRRATWSRTTRTPRSLYHL